MADPAPHRSSRTSVPARTAGPPAVRWSAAALLVVVAVVHLLLVPEHLREAPYAGVLFLLLSLACLALAGLLLRGGTRTAWEAAAVVMVLALVAYVVSRTVGLPQLGDDVGNWGEPLALPALVAEVLVVVLAATALRRSRRVHAPVR